MTAFGRTRISPEADHAVKEFWEYLVFASETIIFILAGIIVAIRVLDGSHVISPENCYKLMGLWGLAMAGRLLSLLLFMPFLKKIGYGLMWS
jgi:NhaP-type Na+/H+ or K+/H+ antiporter